MRRATLDSRAVENLVEISIHALHEESDQSGPGDYLVTGLISIHALHEESDRANHVAMLGEFVISIHALHEESDKRCTLVHELLH